jgi:rhodanese-related sulfurtransferase
MRRFIILSALFTLATLSPVAQADGTDGNRYSLPREYKSEISTAEAYRRAVVDRDGHEREGRGRYGHKHGSGAVIIDVRTIEEYVGGHPPRAYSIPFPHIHNRQHNPDDPYGYIGQDPEDFVAAVNALDLPKDTLIITMCRTGYRSVLAGNLLAEAGYTNVRNMWQGFKGHLKTNTAGEELDLNGDGVVNGDDPYSGDLDGWSNFGGLPVSKKLVHWRLYAPYMNLYYNVVGER